MIEFQGKYTTAKVMIDYIDEATTQQIYSFISHPVFTSPVAIMPDTHKAEGAVIGFTMPMTNQVIPNVVGVDINCAMLSVNVGKNLFDRISKEELNILIRQSIPFGTSVHKRCQFNNNKYSPFWEKINYDLVSFTKKFNRRYGTNYNPPDFSPEWLKAKCKDIKMDYTRALNSVGTLGGGNHFIEIGKSTETGDYWITVHSGSRQLGQRTAIYWQRQAGKGQLAHLEGEDMFGYLTDSVFIRNYSNESRDVMQQLIYRITECDVKESISTIHNCIDFDDFIIRKGAIRSYKNEKMIIPFNMEDGIIICEGKSNPEWNYSAPHGAGRVASRSWAKEHLKVEPARQRMNKKNIYCSKLPLDELKEAYKDPKIIEDAIGPTATIIDRTLPVLAMKD